MSTVLVLTGGPDAENEVSIDSANAIVNALRESGAHQVHHHVIARDEAGGFARYRTWAWIPMDETLASPLLYRNRDLQGWIKGSVERSLAAKGYQSTTYGDADFSVAYQVSVRDVSVVRKQRFRGFSPGYRRDRLPRWREVTRIEEMPEGTLILDVVDPDLDAVVWSGSVSGLVTGEVTEAGVAAAVDALLARYPPQ